MTCKERASTASRITAADSGYELLLMSAPENNAMTISAIFSVVSQHAQGASFLWELRSRAVMAPHYDLADLAKLDQRVEANLDGLRIAGKAGWEVCRDALLSGESGELFAAALLVFESGNEDRLRTVFGAVAASQELSRGLVSAVGWLTFQQADLQIRQLLASPSFVLRRVGIAASAIHRHNPGGPLADAISATDPLLRYRALRAVGELGSRTSLSALEKGLADQDRLCRFWAAWSLALICSDTRALKILQSTVASKVPYGEKALQVVIRRMDPPTASSWHTRLIQDATMIRTAIVAAGAFGDPTRIPWLIEQMTVPKHARVAGEAFTMITGVDVAFHDLDGDKPEGFEAGPTENPGDENVDMDPDENLPWPAPQLIAKWWSQHEGEFRTGNRYLFGGPISVEWCEHVLRYGRQRQRAAAALELAILQPGTPLFNVAAPGFRQQQALGLRP